PPNWIPRFLLIGIAVGAALALLARIKNRPARITFALLAMLWTLLAGFGGAFSTWTWLFTDHLVARQNENWLQLNPLSLAMIVLIPAMLRGKKWGAPRIAMIIAALSLLGLLLKIFPPMHQVNGEIIALALPIHLAL